MTTKSLHDDAVSMPAGQRDWQALVDKALAGAAPGPDGTGAEDGRAAPARTVVQRIDDPNVGRAATQAREEIEQGATGLALVFEGAPNAFGYGLPATAEALSTVLKDVPLEKTYLRFDAHPASRTMADTIIGLLGARKVDPSSLSISFGIDPAAVFAGTGRLRMSIAALKASMPQSLSHFFGYGVPGILLEADGRVFHNAGATEAQEVGAMLSTALTHLRLFQEARQALVYAAPHIGFALSVDQDHARSIAKIRALRQLWARVQQEWRIASSPAVVHAETSYRMLSAGDPDGNMVRNTIAASAAVAGGANSLSVLPHTITQGLPDEDARRIARNIQLALTVDVPAADPDEASITALTDTLCEAAWAELQRLDGEGGILDSLAAGAFQRRVIASREARAKQHADGASRPSGGVSRGPVPAAVLEAPTSPVPTDGAVFCERLEAVRVEQTAAG